MNAWPGKYVIGLTGNIATGKSVVRKMLEHLGAYGIDADALAHRAIARDAPGYQPVVETFGKWVLSPDGQVDRSRLGGVVFSDPEALRRLENIVHPLVDRAVDVLVQRSRHTVIVVEAIKLLESSLKGRCDSIWVTIASPEVQLVRLMKKRGLSESVAQQRISMQSPQQHKMAVAQVLINNVGSYEDTWKQVVGAWQRTFRTKDTGALAPSKAARGELVVQRARPRQAKEIAAFINQITGGRRALNRSDVMAAFGEKAFLLLFRDEQLVGLMGWQVENLVARTDDIYIDPKVPFPEAVNAMMDEVERASRELQSEIALVFLPRELVPRQDVWRALGYQERAVHSLKVRAWEEAASESKPAGSIMFFKQLRKDRVLRPM